MAESDTIRAVGGVRRCYNLRGAVTPKCFGPINSARALLCVLSHLASVFFRSSSRSRTSLERRRRPPLSTERRATVAASRSRIPVQVRSPFPSLSPYTCLPSNRALEAMYRELQKPAMAPPSSLPPALFRLDFPLFRQIESKPFRSNPAAQTEGYPFDRNFVNKPLQLFPV